MIQGDQINMTVLFGYLVKSDASETQENGIIGHHVDKSSKPRPIKIFKMCKIFKLDKGEVNCVQTLPIGWNVKNVIG